MEIWWIFHLLNLLYLFILAPDPLVIESVRWKELSNDIKMLLSVTSYTQNSPDVEIITIKLIATNLSRTLS